MRLLRLRRATVVLVAVALLLAAALVLEVQYLARDTATPSTSRPVVTGEASQRAAVRAAAGATADALSYSHEDFAAQVADATELMTPEFADKYRSTTSAAEEQFVGDRTTQEVRVVGSAVVAATGTRAATLLFLDQYLAKAGAGTSVTRYRALVTVERRNGRWLLDDIETG